MEIGMGRRENLTGEDAIGNHGGRNDREAVKVVDVDLELRLKGVDS